MKVAIITDQHFGARNDSVQFLDFYEKFYENVFFPKLKEEGITTLLILGDTFDRRKYVNFFTFKRARDMFFDRLWQMGIQVHMLAGNHDTYYKNTNEVNSVSLLLREYNNINVIDHPKTIFVNDTPICMMPWICAENYQDSMDTIKDTEASICCGHFEIAGFSMHRGMPSHEGLNREIFRKFEYTFSGHYHHKSSDGDIHYLGNPYELTWQDYNDTRGFHIFDLTTRDLLFVENPFVMFHKIVYDDKEESITEITNKDFTKYTNTYVKVVVVNKTNPYLFDKFMNNLYNNNPIDITIAEDFIDLTEGVEDDIIDQAEDTVTIINKYVDSIKEESIDNDKLKSLLRELYVEALNLEQA
ncbi:endonuclease subunit [uncultured Caudovirales phage]|uniref:Endonuclease subunit n=1 Tax=uncultured Caudovirales phage TaxID=2100421 RepID=A0A6J5LFI2_9CAUD|nr:endonuclease subunit [uncultured Caudovirales phage]